MKTQAVVFILLMACAPFVFAERVAVTAFGVTGYDNPAIVENMIVDIFVAQLVGMPGVQVVERHYIESVLKEQSLSMSDVVDSNTVIRAGKIIGSTAVITGSLTKLNQAGFFSARCINAETGEVLAAVSGAVGDPLPAGLQSMARQLLSSLVITDTGFEAGRGSLVWYTQADSSPAKKNKPILIYVMSNVKDSIDQFGQWYLGPDHLQPVTELLRNQGFSVEVHDRRTLPRLTDIDLARFSQVWVMEADSNSREDTSAAEAAALHNYFLNGGSVWLSGENFLDAADNYYVEDINPYAQMFGFQIAENVFPMNNIRHVPASTHPLLAGVKALLFDTEFGLITYTNKDVQIVLGIEPEARIMGKGITISKIMGLRDSKRLQDADEGRIPDYSWGWLLADKFSLIGPQVGENAAGIIAIDGLARNQGRLIADSGAVMSYAFAKSIVPRTTKPDNLIFAGNAALWLAPR